jgi:hypothetical protein
MPPSNAKVLPLPEMMQLGQPDATRPAADARTSNPARRSVVRRLRGAARVRTEVAVTLRVDGEAHPVTMVNVSERGLGLVGVPIAVPEGRKLAIELPDGTVLSGRAQWSRADRLGVAITGASYLAGMGWKRDPTEAPVADPVNSAALGSTSVGTRILSWFRRAATSARPSSAVPGSARQLERAWRKNGIAVLLPPADGQRD